MFRHFRPTRIGPALAVALATSACGDANILPPATLGVATDTITLWAVTGTDIGLPSAYDLVYGITARTDRTADFDFVFDFVYDRAAGDTVPALLPRGAVGLSADGGLLKVSTPFDSLYSAPGGDYDPNKIVPVDTTTTVVARSRSQYCNYGITAGLYAKIQPLSISRTFRKMIFRMTIDPNCGYRSFRPGVPGN